MVEFDCMNFIKAHKGHFFNGLKLVKVFFLTCFSVAVVLSDPY